MTPLAQKIMAIKAETSRIRDAIVDGNRATDSMKRPITSEDGRTTLHWRMGPFSPFLAGGTVERRRIDCAAFHDGKKVMAADFTEFRVNGPINDHDFFWEMDINPESSTAAIAYLSGWGAVELDERGGFASLNNLASTDAGSFREWSGLLERFIEDKVMDNSVVLLTDPYPHDVVNALRGDEDSDLRNELAKRRHMAKYRFCEEHLGLERFGQEARLNSWMYRIHPFIGLEPDFMNFDNVGADIREGRELRA